ncbi:TonB-dependent receptor [Christiangramia flava]|uniref:Iron(III) dicitrate transport protein FecA n=1 Tax=Christiangramia flava JLT2011 TaxID=1229726 RepID=A0A1L7I0W9_9FLAO|nr:TonB-dependent receptor [Christiangramia flava]APU67221.1 Iron(III) dicitrate transport protein FecA [Christiangramia flava JLT2011]OSS39806.1 Iron(III) dicitrate transport protein FecA [Christiangramia flava JLT2011]
MKLKVFSILFLSSFSLFAQFSISGKVTSAETGLPVESAEVWNKTLGKVVLTDAAGNYQMTNLKPGAYTLVAFGYEYQIAEKQLDLSQNVQVDFRLSPLAESLSEVVLNARKEQLFALRKLRKVEGTAIYAGKKSEVVLMDKVSGNKAANKARQIYSQVVGLNIYDNGDAGIQLNIGGRGLDPNRTQNFNTRQNGYDISADVLGYPESYYTPPAEALEEIQVVRGAASLQYGTQFGGLLNFKFHQPSDKKIEFLTRQSVGSYDLFTSFNSLSGTLGDFSYYTYYNYKGGKGFRPNSEYDSHNAFAHLGWQVSDKTKISFEYTFLDYLAQQPGGLTDYQFYENPDYSNRERNWFDVNWNLFALKLEQQLSENTEFSLNIFGLDASRKALGFRENRVSIVDPGGPRELLVDDFNNWGAEARILTRYQLFGEESVLLFGSKYYQANNNQQQGPGSDGMGPDFSFYNQEYPNYQRQSVFEFPNQNLAFFGENIFNITNEFSITPGIRVEYINTEANGNYKNIVLDLAGNALLDETVEENQDFERSFVLLGVGSSYNLNASNEFYANFSQNYRSVTFNDIRVVNPSYQVDPNISDEKGFTADLGIRGRLGDFLSYDASIFGLKYQDRIGEILKEEERVNAQGELEETGRLIRFRGNIGDAFIYGLETFAEWNVKNSLFPQLEDYQLNLFLNSAFTKSEYIRSEANNVEGNQVEFIPAVNLKTGVNFGYKNFIAGLQYSYLSKQYTDATNAPQDRDDRVRGIEGSIPAYGIMDLSASYSWKRFRLESGINNLLNNSYFTRRATGYPGPGIIPAQPLTWYTTLQFKL